MKITDLKPCPFCGGSNICPSSWDIQCYDCKATLPGEFHLAAPVWNRRAALAVQTQQGVNIGLKGASEIASRDLTSVASVKISSALVDVPAVESEPEEVGWQARYWIKAENRWSNWITNPQAHAWAYDEDRIASGITQTRKLYAHPPRSLSNEGSEVVAAAQRYVDAVNGQPEKDCWDTEDGKPDDGAERFASDWAWKAYDDKKQQAFDALCAALSTPKGSSEGDGSATITIGGDHG